MGQGQSSEPDAADVAGTTKQDYYELLGVERQATEEEIKKAYRRKALELHPDRNYGNVESATKLFAEIQSAYEVLSDPQERAWYDSHRDILLRGDQVPGEANEFSYNIRMTTTDEVLKFMMKFHGRLEYSDSPSGFFGGLRDFFGRLAREEEIACQWEDAEPIEYPDFGLEADDYNEVVRPFYAAWNGFATRKSYSWKDQHRLSEAPDRRIRRLMEKENKRIREEAVREYNDAVRSLIAFVRKRDPRYQENQKSEAERQKILREAAAAQAARSRAARQARMDELDREAIPAWAQSRTVDEHEGGFSSEEESDEHEFECVVCNKSFKSEAQYQAHEKSKKHIKLLKQLKREIREEGHDLAIDDPLWAEEQDEEATRRSAGIVEEVVNGTNPRETAAALNSGEANRASLSKPTEADSVLHSTEEGESDEGAQDHAPQNAVEGRLGREGADDLSTRLKATDLDATSMTSDTETSSRPKLGKAKLKRAKKAAQKADAGSGSNETEFRCAVCQAGFPSKTKLFSHIKDEGHAAPVSQAKGKDAPAKGGKGKKK